MDNFIGQIELFPYGYEPVGWALCDGRLLPINAYSALFSLIGNKYGGDGQTNFALPNLKGTEPIPNTNYYIALEGIYPTRD
ncbi:MAG: phage tail protein [Firmicutes bacterium HGW-Firmicutes-8]|nr:MAG: phage tail protein [Firmicutes bacterium HGW-Firmicutes-8]